jgi:hypothetical protein
MADFTLSIDEDILDVLEAMAKLRNITVAEVLRDMLAQTLDQVKMRMNDPIIGMFDSGQSDISERAEDILRDEWQPD